MKRLLLGALALAIVALQVVPPAIAAYYPPSGAFGPLTGDCTTASAGATATTCTKTNGTAFGTMATQNAGAVAITGGAINGTPIGATTPAAVYSAGEIGGTQSITGASGTVAANVSFVNVNNSSAAVALAGPTSPVVGQHFTIKDGSGTSATNNITYTPGSGITIDGASTYTLSQNRGAINVWVVSATVQAIY